MIETTLLAVLTGALSNLTSDAIKGIIGKLASKHPEVEQQASLLETPLPFDEVDKLFSQMQGAIQAAAAVGVSTMGISGLPLAAVSSNIPVYLLGILTAYAVGFLATWLIGFDDPEEQD